MIFGMKSFYQFITSYFDVTAILGDASTFLVTYNIMVYHYNTVNEFCHLKFILSFLFHLEHN